MFVCTSGLKTTNTTTDMNETNSKATEFCGFESATEINCSVAAVNSVGISQFNYSSTLTQLRLSNPDASYLEVQKVKMNSATVPIKLRKVDVENGNIAYYYILMEEVSASMKKRSISANPCSEFLVQSESEACYPAAMLTAEEVGTEYQFQIGDGQLYSMFENRELRHDTDYRVYLVATAVVMQSYKPLKLVFPPETFKSPPKRTSTAAIAGAAVAAVVIVAALCGGAYFFYRSRRAGNNEPSLKNEYMNLEGPRTEVAENNDAFDVSDGTYGNQETSLVESEPIRIERLGWYIRTNLDAIKAQYEKLKKIPLPLMTEAKSERNQGKCRYKNLYTSDEHRVTLDRDNTYETDFINATYIDGYAMDNHYIASLGPFNKGITCDFWLMIWQQDPSAIVMVTKAEENFKMKCWQYWPEREGNTLEFAEFIVTCKSTEMYADFSMSYLEVAKGEETRVIPHFNFLTWPDHGVPDIEAFIAFHRLIQSTAHTTANQPLLVHCSAGVGRTGTYIALDYLLQQAKEEGKVDMYSFVAGIRTRRPSMIQTVEQYILLHHALYESLSTQSFFFPPSALTERLTEHEENRDSPSDLISVEHKHILERINSLCLSYATANKTEHQEKNRFSEILACDEHRVKFSEAPDDSYINAVAVDGYRTKQKWIATQNPLSHTAIDFWKMVTDQDVKILVQLEGSQTSFYPLTDSTERDFGPFTVRRQSCSGGDVVKIVEILVNTEMEEWKVCILVVKNWLPQDLPPTNLIISVQETVEKLQQQRRNAKICVVCQDGSTRCGLYICAHNAIEKLKIEQEVDIYYPVVMAKLRRPQFVSTMMHYSYLYQVVNDYMENFGEYANFR